MLIQKKGHDDIKTELITALHSLVELDSSGTQAHKQNDWIDKNLKLTLRELEKASSQSLDYLKQEDTFIHSIRNKYKGFLSGLASMEHTNKVPDFDRHIEMLEVTTKDLISKIHIVLNKSAKSPMHAVKDVVEALKIYEHQSKIAATDLKVILKEIGDEYRLLRQMTHSFHQFEGSVRSWLN